MNNRKVLVLNANYKPLCVITWQKAITLLYKENKNVSVNIVKYYKREIIKSSSGDLPAPSIIAINKYIDISKINVKLSKRNIIIRDNKTCQYCGTDLERKNSTLDHVVPKCKFKNKSLAHSWTNLVLACRHCNRSKGNKTVCQANMTLLKSPYAPKYQTRFVYGLSPWDIIPVEWNDFVV